MSKQQTVNILAIESSCDETAASVLSGNPNAKTPRFKLLSSVVNSQIALHQRTGGVVPEVAARAHMQNTLPVTEQALRQAKLTLRDIDYFAVTAGPGLVVSLIVGTEFAKGLALAVNRPLIPVNHMAGHLYSPFASAPATVQFPILCMIVSGGHTLLILMSNFKDYKIIGSTVDDAVGEAFDKVGKLLGLPYPGGPEIARLARHGKTDIKFPRPKLSENNFDFSFSGLKTAVLYYIDKIQAKNKSSRLSLQTKRDIAMSFQNAAVDVLVTKAQRAVAKYHCRTIALSGGVAANQQLREKLKSLAQSENLAFFVPSPELCTDNAQMIAIAAFFHLKHGQRVPMVAKIKADPSWKLT
jgi:N6-L-threonylcarbamoyladenine synthase